ncbi:MAG: AEC family transporter [Clostridia bacterium]|nr:AEC family transporter [Clostridia bacterium]
MESLLFSAKTVLPLLIMMAVGFAARHLGWVDNHATKQMNACVFRIFLPLLLTFNIMDTPQDAAVDTRTLIYALITTMLCFAVLFTLIPRLVRERRDRGVIIQCVARSNYAIFGIPLVNMMYPNADVSIAAMMVAIVVPVFNVMSTIALMVNGSDQKPDAKKILKGVVTNPLIIATAAGFLLWQLNVKLPVVLDKPLRNLANISSPLALFVLGASLDFGKARANAKLLTWSVLGRLVFVPGVFLTGAALLGIRDVALASLIAVYASPCSVSSYPMAQQMGGNDDLAGAQVVFTTTFSVVTVFFWVFILKSLGLLM